MNSNYPFVVLVSANSEWKPVLECLLPQDVGVTPFGQKFSANLGGHPVLFAHGGWGKTASTASCQYLIDRYHEVEDVTVEELMRFIKGPDFPTAGLILGTQGIRDAYHTGRGSVKMRARAKIEPMNGSRQRIVVTEIPYQVNKARLVERIADLARDKQIDGISDLRDESDREGMRVVIELRRDANANVVLNQLYKHTPMESTFGVNMLALVNNEPRVLNIKEILHHYIAHQEEVVTRRTKFDLAKAEDRAHILEGLRIALDHIDEIIALIRASASRDVARGGLMQRFGLTERQANAILDMRLASLTGLEREKIEQEYAEVRALIKRLLEILGDESLLLGVIKDEMIAIRDKFGDDVAGMVTLDHLQGAYIGMAGKYRDQGADRFRAVAAFPARFKAEPAQ